MDMIAYLAFLAICFGICITSMFNDDDLEGW